MSTSSSDAYDTTGGYPIGMVATLTGLPVDVIRVWERRYGLLRPSRSAGGHRLYSPRDVLLLRRAVALRARGLSAARACAHALAEAAQPPAAEDTGPLVLGTEPSARLAPATAALGARLYAAAVALDAAAVRAVLDEGGALLDVETLWGTVLAPALARLGTDWAGGLHTPAPEHLLSSVIRGRLVTLVEALPRVPSAPMAVVGGAPGERHELAALMLALLVGRAGWAVTYLGADTPPAAWEEAMRVVRPRVAIVAATLPEHAAPVLAMLRRLRRRLGRQVPRLAYGGPAFAGTPTAAGDTGPLLALGDDLDEAIRRVRALA